MWWILKAPTGVCVCAGVRWQSSDISSSAASEGARLRVSGIPLQGKYWVNAAFYVGPEKFITSYHTFRFQGQ